MKTDREGPARILRALRHRNYRLYFLGQSCSVVGTWMQQTALGWLVYRLTLSPLWLGVVGFADKVPVSLLAPLAGVWLDRYSRHRIILVTQTLALVQALALAALVAAGVVQIWQVLVLAVFLGLINAFDIPGRQSFTIEIVEDKADLGNAIALNSTVFNSARLLGPSLAGALIASAGEAFCFFANAVSYVPVLLALTLLKLKAEPPKKTDSRPLEDLREGFRYAFGFKPTRSILLLLALTSLTGTFTVLLPVFAARLGGGAGVFGVLLASSGAGALVGALFLAARRTVLGLGRWIVAASSLFGAGMFAFSFSRGVGAASAFMVVTGFGMMVHIASSNTVLQTIVEEDKRGRVMSFYVLAITGMAPFGSLLAGWLASRIGAAATLRIDGACCMLGSALFATQLPAIRRLVRPIYLRMGILGEEAAIEEGLGLAGTIENLEE